MAIGSAIERGSFICVYDEHGHHAVLEGEGIRPQGRACWDSLAPPSPCASARSSTPTASAVRRYSPRPHDGSCDPGRAALGTTDALVAVDRHDRPANPRNGLLERL